MKAPVAIGSLETLLINSLRALIVTFGADRFQMSVLSAPEREPLR